MEIQHACRYSSQSGLSSTKIARFNSKITPGSRREKVRKKRQEEKRTRSSAWSVNKLVHRETRVEGNYRKRGSQHEVGTLGVCDERKSTTFVELDPDNRRTRSPHEIPFLLVLTIEKTARNGRATGPVSRCLSVARYFVSSRLTSSNRETLPTRRRFSSRWRNWSVTSSLETAPNTTYLSSVTPRFLSINGADPRIPLLSLSRCAQHALYAFRSKRYVACAWSLR